MRLTLVTALTVAIATASCGGAPVEEQYAQGTCRVLEAMAVGESGIGRMWTQRLRVAENDGLDREVYIDAVMNECPGLAAQAFDAIEEADG